MDSYVPPSMPQQSEPSAHSRSRVLSVIIILGVIFLLAAAVIFFLNRREENASLSDANAPLVNQAGEQLVKPNADQDRDLLSDAEEAQYGTKPDVEDTDGDGLPDGFEVRTTKTNPTNPRSKDAALTDLQWAQQQ